jgi:enamidase
LAGRNFSLKAHRRPGRFGRTAAGRSAHGGVAVQLAKIRAELVFCFATGNTARIRKLNCGLVEVGRAADFIFMDRAQHTAGKTLLHSVQLGDIPGVGMVMIDGMVVCGRSRNTPPATEVPMVLPGQ